MTRRLITDAWHLEAIEYDGRPIFEASQENADGTHIELENGTWLTGYGDGRFYEDADSNALWGSLVEWDDTAEEVAGFLGYVKV